MVANGGGRHVYYLSNDEILRAAMWSYISQVPIVIVFGTAKASVALLILRFVGHMSVWRRTILIFIMVSAMIINLLVIPLTFAQCNPSRALWDKTITGATCWKPNVVLYFDYFQIAYNVFCDVVLALLPATIIYKLQMNQGRKITLGATLGLGLLYVSHMHSPRLLERRTEQRLTLTSLRAAFCGGIKIRYQEQLSHEIDFTCKFWSWPLSLHGLTCKPGME